MSALGWSDRVEAIKQRARDRDKPKYTDQDGNDVPICMVCQYWRATVGDMCEMCAYDVMQETMEE